MTTADRSFDNPPVRAVELSIYFDQIPLRLISMAPLVSKLQEAYPDAAEEFARVPWKVEADDTSFAGYIPESSEHFPFPWLTLSNPSGHSVSFQDDRIILRWEFNKTAQYPGYEILRNNLQSFFNDFSDHASNVLNETIVVRKVRGEYTNSTGPEVPWTVSQKLYSRHSEDDNADLLPGLQGANSGGLFHFDDDDLATHVEFVAISDRSESSLSLRSSTFSTEEAEDEAKYEELTNWAIALDVAHKRLIECFDQLTTSKQKLNWGQR